MGFVALLGLFLALPAIPAYLVAERLPSISRTDSIGITVVAALLPSAVLFWLMVGTGDSMIAAGSFYLVPVLFVFGLIAASFGVALARHDKAEQ